MDVLQFPSAESSQVEILQALVDAAESLKDSEDGGGVFVVYVNAHGIAELVGAGNVSASEVIAACFTIATEQVLLLQGD